MAPRAALFAGILACASCATPPPPPATPHYSFELDGIPLHPRILSMDGNPSAPRAGDLVEVDGRLLVLDDAGPHRWRRSPDATIPLVRVREDGSEVAAFLDCSEVVPAAGVPVEGIRGVRIHAWTNEVADLLGPLDPERYCLEIRGKVHSIAFDLPKGLRHLAVHTERIPEDLEGRLCNLPRLLSLGIVMEWLGEDFDASWIEGLGELRFLALSRVQIAHVDRLGQLAGLRELDLLRCDEPGKSFHEASLPVGFLADLPRLRRLDVYDSAVRDLEPAGGHPALEFLRANGGIIERLPSRRLPGLRELMIPGGRALSPTAIEFFRSIHPGCRVISDWGEVLRDSTAGADRIRFRTGGTCHRVPENEKTLSDENDPQAVTAFLDCVRLVPQPDGGRCMCCGGPTVEIYSGGTLVAELGMQHAHSLRWLGAWPGDAAMTLESAEDVCRWMASHGDDGPLQAFEKDAARRWASRRRWQIVQALLPEAFRTRLEDVNTIDAALEAFEKMFPDDVERATLALRIYGAGEGSWIRPFGLEYMAEEALQRTPAEQRGLAMNRATDDAPVADGVARWVFHKGKPEDVPDAVRNVILGAAAERSLAHPRPFNRRRTMEVLGDRKGEQATELLRRMLAGSIPIRDLPADLVEEPFEGFVPPATGDVYAPFSDRAYAALLLARRGDRASLPAIASMEGSAADVDRDALRTARELLEGK